MNSLKRTPKTVTSSSSRGMLCCLMGATLERLITKELFFSVDYCIVRWATVPSADCDASVNIKRPFLELIGKTCIAEEKLNHILISRGAIFGFVSWNVIGKLSTQETAVRQTSCRMYFNVTTAGAKKPNGSKTEATRDRSFHKVNLVSSVVLFISNFMKSLPSCKSQRTLRHAVAVWTEQCDP